MCLRMAVVYRLLVSARASVGLKVSILVAMLAQQTAERQALCL